MLLTELTGVKHLYTKTREDLINMLEQRGIKFIGGGKYGSVFAHDSWNYVLKIVEDDPHYLAFVDWAMKHPSPNFPKFEKKPLKMHVFHQRNRGDSNTMWVIKIEKLQPIQDKKLLQFLVSELENMAVAAWRHENGRDIAEPRPHYMQNMPDGTQQKGVTWADMFKQFPWMYSLGLTYANFWEAEAGVPDIHGDNLMQRSDGTIVITDPVWEGETPYQAYDKWVRDQMDHYVDDGERDLVSGPSYYIAKKRKEIVTQLANDFLDDIPF